MTEPVILLGTQSNGETLPVQVDAFGRLVAEGLQGTEGPEGPEGPPGADGGSFPLPPDPYEGALLGWLNGGLSWVGTPTVPIPPGVFGPITGWDPSGVLTVASGIPENVSNGVYLYQCDATGALTNPEINAIVTKNWSELGTTTDFTSGRELSNAFNNVNTISSLANVSFSMLDIGIENVTTMQITLASGASETLTQSVQVNDGDFYEVTGGNSFMQSNPINVPLNGGSLDKLYFPKGFYHAGLYEIVIDGQKLVDSSVGEVIGRVNQRVGETQILIAPSGDYQFVVGEYLKIPGQRVAPWVLYGNDPTSLIDHLRSS